MLISTLSGAAFLAAVLLLTAPSREAHSQPDGAGKLGPGVGAASTASSDVRVIVTLREPAELQRPRVDLGRLRTQVSTVQTDFIDDLVPERMTVTRRYTAVPAVAGWISPDDIDALAARPDVSQIALDGIGDAGMALTIPMIHANETFDAEVRGTGQVVAVIDTGIDTDHVDLADSIAYEVCFLSGGGCPPGPHVAEDDHGHGTNVAGVITSNGTLAPRGVAPNAQVGIYKVLGASGSGLFSDWLAALDDIIVNHSEVDFVNMSLQSSFACPNEALDTAVTTLHNRGTGVFIAAGNHGQKEAFTVPSCLTDAVTVGAVYDSSFGASPSLKSSCSDPTTAADVVACWSDSSPDLDLLAPGAYVTSTGRTGPTSTFLGTSQASPHAAAVAALAREALPGLALDQIIHRMKSTGTIITDDLDDGDPDTMRQTPRIDARVALLTNDNADYDGDGCTNGQEYGPDRNLGGQRNPLWEWDYMNPTGDGQNRVDDILMVVGQYFVDAGEPGYLQATDRSYVGPYLWSLGPPNGLQRIDDVIASISQYFADCQ